MVPSGGYGGIVPERLKYPMTRLKSSWILGQKLERQFCVAVLNQAHRQVHRQVHRGGNGSVVEGL